MRLLPRICLPFFVLVCFCLIVHAELTPEQTKAAQGLIAQFTAPEFAVRQQAVEKLIALGPDVLPLVRKTLAETKDAEVKLRCEMVLKGIAEKFGVEAPTEKPLGAFGLDASRVSVKVRDARLASVLDAFAGQSGNARIEVPEPWAGKLVTLEVADMPYWQALDALCREAGLFWAPGEKTGQIELLSAEDALDVSAYAGPVVVKLVRGESMRRAGAPLEVRYRFDFICEDRLEPFAADIRFTKWLGRDGTTLRRTGTLDTRVRRVPGGVFNGIGPIAFEELPAGTDRLGVLEGTVTLCFGGGRKTLTTEDVFARPESTLDADGARLTLGAPTRTKGWVTMTLVRKVDGKEHPMPFFTADSPYGFRLVDPNGGRHAGVIYQGSEGGGVALWDLDRRRLVFSAVPEVEGKWTLQCVLPVTWTEKTFPFRFEQVPLP